MLLKLLSIVLAFLVLRRLLGWAFQALGRVSGQSEGKGDRRAAEPTRREELSDQPIEEADYEELP
jgi:hypothetical protein